MSDIMDINIKIRKNLVKRLVNDPYSWDWQDKEELVMVLEQALKADEKPKGSTE